MVSATQLDLSGKEFLSSLGLYNAGSVVFLPYKVNMIIYTSSRLFLAAAYNLRHEFFVCRIPSSKQGGMRTDVVSSEAKEKKETGIMNGSLEIMKNAFSTIVALFHPSWPFGRQGHS